MTVVSTSGYTYLSPPVIVFNRHNWGWGSCTKKRHSSVFEQETIISELNHSLLALWFSPLSYTHTNTHALNMKVPIYGGAFIMYRQLPGVLWLGRALASEQRARPRLVCGQRCRPSGVTWVLRAEQELPWTLWWFMEALSFHEPQVGGWVFLQRYRGSGPLLAVCHVCRFQKL